MSRFVLLSAGVLLLCAAIAHAQTATQPAVTPENAALAEQFYKLAKAAKSAGDAMTAVKQALGYDPSHLGANIKLAELLVDAEQLGPAIEQLAKAEALLASQPDAPAELKAQLAAVQKKLAGLRETARKWADLRKAYADKYAILGEQPAVAGMPSTALAFCRAAALNPADKQIATQKDGAINSLPKLPAAADKPNPDGAKLLVSQAGKLLSSGKFAEAGELLKSAVSLDPNPPGPWCDLAICATGEKNPVLAANCLAAARDLLSNETDADAADKPVATIARSAGIESGVAAAALHETKIAPAPRDIPARQPAGLTRASPDQSERRPGFRTRQVRPVLKQRDKRLPSHRRSGRPIHGPSVATATVDPAFPGRVERPSPSLLLPASSPHPPAIAGG